MTNTPPNPGPNARKVVQQLKATGDQNERMLVRTITTILASVGTLAGWMILAGQEATPVADAVEPIVEEPTETAWPTETPTPLLPTPTVAFAPIPTLRAIPGRQVLPTLMPTSAGAVIAAAAGDTQSASTPVVPTAAPQGLRVVVVPTAAPAEVTAGNPAPAQPAPGQPGAGQPQPTAVPQPPAPTAVPKPKPKPTAAGHSKGSK